MMGNYICCLILMKVPLKELLNERCCFAPGLRAFYLGAVLACGCRMLLSVCLGQSICSALRFCLSSLFPAAFRKQLSGRPDGFPGRTTSFLPCSYSETMGGLSRVHGSVCMCVCVHVYVHAEVGEIYWVEGFP